MPRKKKTEMAENPEKETGQPEEEADIQEEQTKEHEEKIENRLNTLFGELKMELEPPKKQLLIPLEEYVKAGVHLGTKIISGDMRRYVYRRRADGLAILNTNLIDEGFREAAKFMSKYNPDEIILVCKREAGWLAAKVFSETTGIRAFPKKYPAGIMTNPALKDFFQPSLVIICDPWIDRNAMNDSRIINIPVIGLCDTNNLVKNIDLVVPCNNKSNKTLGLAMHILASEYCKARGMPFKAEISDFTGEEVKE